MKVVLDIGIFVPMSLDVHLEGEQW